MNTDPAGLLLANGALVLFLGLLVGYRYWLTIVLPADRERRGSSPGGWRVAHATLVEFGLVMLVVGMLLPGLDLEPAHLSLMAWSLVVAGYGFSFAMTLGAVLGNRGLTPIPFGITTLLFTGHLAGALGSTLGVGILLYGLLA